MVGSFSFDTPEEVMHVLASIRASSVDAAAKNQLRDLVLSYTNGGKDPSLKIQIEQQLTQLGIAPSVAPTTLSTVEPTDFGSSRSVPSFSAPAPSKPVTSAAPATAVATPASPEPTPQPAAAQPAAAPTPAPAAVSPAPAPTASTPAASAATPAPAVPVATSGEPLRRIREIKALVNEKVGNPVNLVDIDNAVGREYMAALLDAMKKLNGGGDIAAAMGRLETAYTAVEVVLETRPANTQSVTPAAQPVAAPAATATQPQPTATAAAGAAAVSIPVRSAAPKVFAAPEPDGSSATRWANTKIRVPDAADFTPTPGPVAAATPQAPQSPQPPATPAAAVTPVQVTKPVISAAPTQTPSVDLAPPVTPPEPAPSPTIKPLSKTGDPLRSMNDLPTADSLETSSKAGDPLYTNEVDDGLNQLLLDWILFKKSGLLGAGPKGTDHPLYLKVKDLQIPVLLAGRFEGATQEIKQSITDYMNGWRYEQGIIYEQGETFEHYLRRVIRHILDLQK